MAEYDFAGAKKYIQMHSDLISSAALGMYEDWFWTAQTVYEDEKFCIDLDEKDLKIGGISGSDWATPTLEIEFKNGTETKKDCFVGDAGGQKPEWFTLGCLSEPIQKEREGLKLIENSGV